jgi:hypothetical protein
LSSTYRASHIDHSPATGASRQSDDGRFTATRPSSLFTTPGSMSPTTEPPWPPHDAQVFDIPLCIGNTRLAFELIRFSRLPDAPRTVVLPAEPERSDVWIGLCGEKWMDILCAATPASDLIDTPIHPWEAMTCTHTSEYHTPGDTLLGAYLYGLDYSPLVAGDQQKSRYNRYSQTCGAGRPEPPPCPNQRPLQSRAPGRTIYPPVL